MKTLQNNFSSTNLVNTSALVPQESGSAEHHSFQLNITIQNGTTRFFAVQSLDQQSAKSEVSNIARVTNYAPSPRPPPISNPGLNLTAIIVSVCVVTVVACVLAVVIETKKLWLALSLIEPSLHQDCKLKHSILMYDSNMIFFNFPLNLIFLLHYKHSQCLQIIRLRNVRPCNANL